MQHYIKNYIKSRIIKSDFFKKQSAKNYEFEPYIKELDIEGISSRFFFATPQAKEWYDPIKPYAKLEYEWVINNIKLKKQKILDCGAHHGQYSVVFLLGASRQCDLIAVDPFPMNCALTEINLKLNDTKARIVQCAVSDKNGDVHFEKQSNGRIIANGGILVKSCTLDNILSDAEVVKLDIEGMEYAVVSESIDKLKSVHSWIIEIHPFNNPHPDQIIQLLLDRGYEILYVNREKNQVEQYRLKTEWNIHSTIFACRQILQHQSFI